MLDTNLHIIDYTQLLAILAPKDNLRCTRHICSTPDIEVRVLRITFLLRNSTGVHHQLILILVSYHFGSLGTLLQEILSLSINRTCRILIVGIILLSLAWPSLAVRNESCAGKISQPRTLVESYTALEQAGCIWRDTGMVLVKTILHQRDSLVQVFHDETSHLVARLTLVGSHQNFLIVRECLGYNRKVAPLLQHIEVAICSHEVDLTDILVDDSLTT